MSSFQTDITNIQVT